MRIPNVDTPTRVGALMQPPNSKATAPRHPVAPLTLGDPRG